MISNIIALGIYPVMAILSFLPGYDGENKKEFFGKRQTITVKGIMILMVFFHHFSHICTDAEMIEKGFRAAHVCITFFFFLAGYTEGLGHIKGTLSLKEKWINRAWRLYLPIMVFTLPYNNFLTPLLIFFILSDVAHYFCKANNLRLAIIAAGNILYVVICMAIGIPEYWYDDVLTFFVGVGFAMYKSEILKFFENKLRYTVSMIILAVISGIFFHYAMNYIYFDISLIIYSFAACLAVVLIMMKRNVKSKIFYFIGQYTWEIYIFHQMFMTLLVKVFNRNSAVLILSFLLSLGAGIALQASVKAIRNNIEKRKAKAY